MSNDALTQFAKESRSGLYDPEKPDAPTQPRPEATVHVRKSILDEEMPKAPPSSLDPQLFDPESKFFEERGALVEPESRELPKLTNVILIILNIALSLFLIYYITKKPNQTIIGDAQSAKKYLVDKMMKVLNDNPGRSFETTTEIIKTCRPNDPKTKTINKINN
jgi:hypothetical protein